MAVYQYIAKDGAGRKFSGIYTDIEDVTDLRQELSKISCVLLKARQKKEIVVKHKSIKKSEIVTFAYKLSGMYSAGLPILNCLETLESQADNPALKYILGDITKSIKDGANLKEACAKHRQIFSDFFIAMVEAGESSGKLGTTLEMSAEYMEKQEDVRRKVISAFTYPVAVSITCFAVIVFLLAFVMPTFVKLYQQAHVELPLPTRILIGLSDGVINYWWAIIILVIGGVIIVRKMLKEQHLRLKWDTFKLNVPGISRLSRLLVVSHFTRTFSMLISVGIPIIDAVKLASAVAHNLKFGEIAGKLENMIRAGVPVAKTFRSDPIFPAMVVEMAASGEQAGELSKMLNKGVDLIDKDIDASIGGLLAKLEPLLTVVMGVIVGLILIGAYLPMFDYMRHLE